MHGNVPGHLLPLGLVKAEALRGTSILAMFLCLTEVLP